MSEQISLKQIQDVLREADLGSMPDMRVAVLRNVTVETLEPYLRFHALRIGRNAQVRFGEYNAIYQEAVGGSGIMDATTDCVLVFMILDELSWKLSRCFTAFSREEIGEEVRRIEEHVAAILQGIRAQTSAMILWHGFEPPAYPAYGIWDGQGVDSQGAVVRKLNDMLRTSLRAVENAYFVDMGVLLLRVGADGFYDPRHWYLSRAPYAPTALRAIAEEDARYLRVLTGRNKKCLVLDCDNVLWGGILSEDGMYGIKLGNTYPGSPYMEFQQEVLSLYHRGILLCLCSKNNEADVLEVLRTHADMVLREEHIAAARINWEDKASNIAALACELNIGLDSMVFMDDSPFEINLVRQVLPEVMCIHCPADKPVFYRDLLRGSGLFDTLTVTREDRMRGAAYKAESNRRALRAQTTDLTGYLTSLDMKMTIASARDANIARIAQLTQKTNQFNLTTRRYADADIRAMSRSADHEVFCLSLRDNFGDFGIVGAVVLAYEGSAARFDIMLLSCRALGRGVEDVLLAHALDLARGRGLIRAVGEYLPTAKNVQVATFYASRGFVPLSEGPQGGEAFGLDLRQGPQPQAPSYCQYITILPEADGSGQ